MDLIILFATLNIILCLFMGWVYYQDHKSPPDPTKDKHISSRP